MLGSIRIATVRGIPVKVHFSLLLLFGLLVLSFGLAGVPAGAILLGSVLLHELGHSVVAQRFGIQISSINLHLLGGTAVMADTPTKPVHEILIAAAGPAVSFVLAALAYGAAGRLSFDPSEPHGLLAYAATVNLAMGVFNLIPAFPLDGGRIFRAVLSMGLGPYRGTRLAARISRGFAVLFALGGLFGGAPTLVLIGIALFVMSGHELRAAELAEARRKATAYAEDWFKLSWAPPRAPGGAGPVIDLKT